MWKPIDFECDVCGFKHEEFFDIGMGAERPTHTVLACPGCNGELTMHHSVIGLPAPYMGEKVLNPRMYGGNYDTMGAREFEPLPDLPGQEEHSAKLRKAMSQLPDTASSAERSAVFREACNDAPSSADYASLFARPEYKEAERANKEIAKQNASKRKRAKAIARGENVNMRRDRCPGDPKITA
jgi:hypothetical protein